MRMTSIWRCWFGALAILWVAMAQPARANFFDDVGDKVDQCIAAAQSVGSAYIVAAQNAPGIAECAGTLGSSNVVGTAITGVIAGMYLAGVFDTVDQCNGLIVGAVAMALGNKIAEIPGLEDALVELFGERAVKKLIDLAAEAIVEEASNIPGLSVVFSYITCGCTLIGGLAEIKDAMIEAKQDSKECLGPIGDAIGWLEAQGDWVWDHTLGAIPSPFAEADLGDHYYIDPNKTCPVDEYWSSGNDVYTKAMAEAKSGQLVLPDNSVSNFKSYGMCTCPAGTLPVNKIIDNVGYIGCGCGEDQVFNDAKQCVDACTYGSKYSFKHHQCEPICKYGVFQGYDNHKKPICFTSCDDPAAVFDVTKGACEVCPANFFTIRTGIGGDARGHCMPCGDNFQSKAGATTCEIICEDPWTKYTSTSWKGVPTCEPKCASGLQYIETKGDGDAGPPKWECKACPENTQLDPRTNSCEPCAQGASWSAGGGAFGGNSVCTCPVSMVAIDGVCQPCPAGSMPGRDEFGNMVCSACPGGSCGPDRQAAECRNSNGVYDATAKTCTPCGKNERVMGNVCISQTVAKPPAKVDASIPKQPGSLSMAPCPGPNEVREALSGQCVSCGDEARATGGICIPIEKAKPPGQSLAGSASTPTAPSQLLQPCNDKTQVRDPYSLRCVSCGDKATAVNGFCIAKDAPMSVPAAPPNALTLLATAPSNKPCPPGTYASGPYCVQEVLPQKDAGLKRCAPRGRDQVIDGRADGGCVPCGAGRRANAERTGCLVLASLPPPARPVAKKETRPVKPALKGESATVAAPKRPERPERPATPVRPSLAPALDFDGPSMGSQPGASGRRQTR